MGEVITFTSGKGGVGKTTTTANVGVGLSLFDKKVVLVDTDIGLRNLDVVMGLENRILYNLVDVLTGKCRLKQALIRDKRYPNLSIIPSSCSNECKDGLNPKQMTALIAELRESFDFVLIDSPAGIDEGFRLAISDADRVIVVTTPQIAAIHDADCVLQLLKRRKACQADLLVNCFRRQMVRAGNMLDLPDICALLETEPIGVVLEDEEIIISQNRGEPISGSHAAAAVCYRNIARRLLGEDLPIPDYTKRGTLFSKVFFKNNVRKRV